jgi:hypothetical protein
MAVFGANNTFFSEKVFKSIKFYLFLSTKMEKVFSENKAERQSHVRNS